jgi:TetR/AcrR family transcriptional regulator of autoinduction and epiphytic fitness
MEQDKRERILLAAEHLFTAYGVKSTTMEQIAKQSKLGKGTIYLYFTDKEALFAEVLERNWTEFSRLAIEKTDPKLGFIPKVSFWLKRITQHRAQDPFFNKIYGEYIDFQTAEIAQGLKKVQLSAVRIIEEMVREGIQAGEVSADLSPLMLSFMLVKSHAAFVYEWPKEFAPIGEGDISALLEGLLGVHQRRSGGDQQ